MRIRALALLITLALGLLVSPLPTEAQQTQIPRIGYLRHLAGPNAFDKAFSQGMRDLGWIEGQNIAIEYRWAAGKRERLSALAEELVRLKVDLIVTAATFVARTAKNATSTIPIVTMAAADAVEEGLIASLARPGGNITGMSEPLSDLHTKLLAVLHETLPQVTRVAFLWNPTKSGYTRAFRKAQAMAPSLGLTIQSLALRNAEELESGLEVAVQERAGALVVPPGMYGVYGQRIAAFSAKHRVPVFTISRSNAERYFGLLSYAPDWYGMARRAATYVDRILKGAKPGDLPVERPQKFDLIVYLKTAKQLGITIPPTILYQATKVIQ